MLEFFRANPFLLGALSGSLAAYVLGLFVSHLRRERRWMGYSVSSRNIVQGGHSKLAMKYENRDVVRLDSHTIIVSNIGNRPLASLPVRVECAKGGEIVEHELHAPDGAKCSGVGEGTTALVVTTDLLNPGEAVLIGLTVADASASDVKVIARGELLEVRRLGSEDKAAERAWEAVSPLAKFLLKAVIPGL